MELTSRKISLKVIYVVLNIGLIVEQCTVAEPITSSDIDRILEEFEKNIQHEKQIAPKSLSEIRQSVYGSPLPGARELSVNIFTDIYKPASHVSHMFTFYGQMLVNDITDTPLTKVNGLEPDCCPLNNQKTPECLPISVGPDDPFFSRFNETCISFVRRAPYATCRFSKREHMNSVPAFIDAHFTYGRTEAEADSLKADDESGLLLTQDSPYGQLLPENIVEDDAFCVWKNTTKCFRGGDSRTNQHPVLMSLQMAWLREHNRMAKILKNINPHWSGAKVYHVSRRILGAKMQCITYKEYLPLLLGPSVMHQYGLRMGKEYEYDATLDPSVSAEFAGFGLRIHSMIHSLIGKGGCAMNKLRDMMYNTSSIHEGCAEDYLKGSCRSPSQEFGTHFVPDITEYGFRMLPYQTGTDLAAVDIQRGRDEGIPPYVNVVEHLQLTGHRILTFDDLRNIMYRKNIHLLQSNYKNPLVPCKALPEVNLLLWK